MATAEQRERFIQAVRKVGYSEDETEFDKVFRRIVKPKPA
jgi:hypothetical protein